MIVECRVNECVQVYIFVLISIGFGFKRIRYPGAYSLSNMQFTNLFTRLWQCNTRTHNLNAHTIRSSYNLPPTTSPRSMALHIFSMTNFEKCKLLKM